MTLREVLTGAVVMAPMTKGSNRSYRQRCVELGARVTISEMTVARRLTQRRKGEFALIRKFEGEPFFGVQLAGTNPEDTGWAAALVESRGARPPAATHPPDRRFDEEGRYEHSGDGEAPPRLERRGARGRSCGSTITAAGWDTGVRRRRGLTRRAYWPIRPSAYPPSSARAARGS